MLSQIMRAVLVTAALIFASGVNAAPINPQILSQIAALIEQRRRDPRFGMRRKEAMAIFGIGLTRVMTLESDQRPGAESPLAGETLPAAPSRAADHRAARLGRGRETTF